MSLQKVRDYKWLWLVLLCNRSLFKYLGVVFRADLLWKTHGISVIRSENNIGKVFTRFFSTLGGNGCDQMAMGTLLLEPSKMDHFRKTTPGHPDALHPKWPATSSGHLGNGCLFPWLGVIQEYSTMERPTKHRYFPILVFPWFGPVPGWHWADCQMDLFGQASGSTSGLVQLPYLITANIFDFITANMHLQCSEYLTLR